MPTLFQMTTAGLTLLAVLPTSWTHAAVPRPDPRVGLVRGGARLGFSPAEITRVREATGRLECDAPDGRDVFDATAVAIGADDQIVTTAHSLYDDENRTYVDPGVCTFVSLSDPPVRRRLRAGFAGAAFGTASPLARANFDWVVLKLASPLPKGRALTTGFDVRTLRPGQTIYQISAQQDSMKRPIGPFEPIAVACAWWAVREGHAEANSILLTDCASTRGASGSPVFVRGPDGVLELIGLHRGSGLRKYDGQPFNYSIGNYSRQLLFDGPLAAAIARTARLRLDENSSQRPPPPPPPRPHFN